MRSPHIQIYNNAGAHNSIFRGKDITDLFYDGTLSKQIAAGTFDDIFIGDYITGKTSKRKYLVADIDYRLHCGDTELKTHHVLMIPEKNMGTAKMNESNITTGGYPGSNMYKTNLTTHKNVIKTDFGSDHILSHRQYFATTITNGYPTGGAWSTSDIDLMSERMVYGAPVFTPMTHHTSGATNTTIPANYTIDKSQLSIFKLNHNLIVAMNSSNTRESYWLRDVVSSASFALVYGNGLATSSNASGAVGVRPAFLIY